MTLPRPRPETGVVSDHLARRVAALERRAAPAISPAPCFVLAEDVAAADCEVARILAAHPNAPRALFVMIGGRQEPGQPTGRDA